MARSRSLNRLSYNSASFQGVQTTINKLKKFGSIGENRIKIISNKNAQDIAQMARGNIASYGKLGAEIANSITVESTRRDKITYTVRVGMQPMSAYVEFGTGTEVEVPKGWEQIAMHYFVNGRGYMPAYPYLSPAYFIGRRVYKKELKESLNYLIERFNSNSI